MASFDIRSSAQNTAIRAFGSVAYARELDRHSRCGDSELLWRSRHAFTFSPTSSIPEWVSVTCGR
jgi:hypothetical protein